MTAPQDSTGAAPDPKLYRITFYVCWLCLAGAGGECHVPGCTYWMKEATVGSDLAWLRERREEVGT